MGVAAPSESICVLLRMTGKDLSSDVFRERPIVKGADLTGGILYFICPVKASGCPLEELESVAGGEGYLESLVYPVTTGIQFQINRI